MAHLASVNIQILLYGEPGCVLDYMHSSAAFLDMFVIMLDTATAAKTAATLLQRRILMCQSMQCIIVCILTLLQQVLSGHLRLHALHACSSSKMLPLSAEKLALVDACCHGAKPIVNTSK